jgi:hypothetical protein
MLRARGRERPVWQRRLAVAGRDVAVGRTKPSFLSSSTGWSGPCRTGERSARPAWRNGLFASSCTRHLQRVSSRPYTRSTVTYEFVLQYNRIAARPEGKLVTGDVDRATVVSGGISRSVQDRIPERLAPIWPRVDRMVTIVLRLL